MTDKKPRCRCKFCGWNYQDTCCCPNPITPNPIQGHTYEFEQGKLAGKKELIDEMETECQNGVKDRLFPKDQNTYEYEADTLLEWARKRLKSQLSKDEVKKE